MEIIYNQIIQKLSTIDFANLYPDFKPYQFALYDEKQIYYKNMYLPKTEQFIGNTAIEYNDEYIAIWKLTGSIDINILTSKIVHEMFHAFQLSNNETRFPNEIKGLDYRYESINILYKFCETRDLISSFRAKQSLSFFLDKRKYREELYSLEVDYESKIETVEGTAQYIELLVLKQLDGYQYTSSLNNIINRLQNPKNYLDTRRISYDIGTILLLTILQQKIVYKTSVKDEKTPYHKLSKTSNAKAYKPDEIDTRFIQNYLDSVTNEIENIITNSTKKLFFDKIVGLDPMNTKKINNKYLFKHFVMVTIGDENKTVMTTSVAIVEQNGRSILLY